MPLVQLIDFPDYDIDTATGDVFRRKAWSGHKQELPPQGYQMKRILRGTPKYKFQVGNTQRTCTVGRLLASARLGVSLERLPRRMIFRPDGSVTTYHEMRIEACQRQRSRNRVTTDAIQEMEDNLSAYKAAFHGDFSLLFVQLEKIRQRVVRSVQRSVGGACPITAEEGWSEAVDHLVRNIQERHGNVVVALRPYMRKLAIGFCRKAITRMLHNLEYHDGMKPRKEI